MRAPDAGWATGVALVPATREDEPLLERLLELYSHDFSEFIDLPIGEDGRFGYPRLPLYFAEERRFPFLVRVDGRLAGLAMVTRGSRFTGDAETYDMTEFFVLRGYRGRGIGRAAARLVWERFPGRWEVRVIEGNLPAFSFWRAATTAFAGSAVQQSAASIEGKRWYVFSFPAPAATPSG